MSFLLRSFPLFRAFGIPVRVHGSLLVFLPLLALGWGGSSFPFALLFLVLIFGCVLLHELGHALAALSFRIPVRGITLYPIGGVAGLAVMPREPYKELIITIAGPAVNFLIAALLVPVWLFVPVVGGMAGSLLFINLALGIFNMLPGYPMDGGRVLRALLATRLPHSRATRIAARVGQGTAVLLGLLAFTPWFSLMLLAIAFFVWMSAEAEVRALGNPAAQAYFQRPVYMRSGERSAEGETFLWGDGKPRDVSGAGTPPRGAVQKMVIEVLPDGTVRRTVIND